MDEALLLRFKTLLEQDPATLAYAREHLVFALFRLTDTCQEISIWFKEGQVFTGSTRLPGKVADVEISLKSDQFEALMAGKLNGYFAAMNGKICVDGDVLKATDLLKLQKDFTRLYSEARAGN